MSDADRERWNRRHSAAETNSTPSAWLLTHAALIRPRRPDLRALDLACGTGQNALCLARLGYQVDAWDISDVALDRLRAQLEASDQSLGVTPRQVDLDLATIPTKPTGDARAPAYLLEPGRLRAAFAQLETLAYVEDPVDGCAALVARRTAQS